MQKILVVIICLLAVLAFIIGMSATTSYYASLPEHINQHSTIVLGQNRLVPGSKSAMRVVVRNSKNASPLPEAEVSLAMAPAGEGKVIPLFSGKTDATGTVDVSFTVPDVPGASQNLIIETKSNLGTDKLTQPVTIERDYRVLLSTDKPLYQPGQIIHIRALVLGAFDLSPASSQEVEVIIADGKGNKVFRKKLSTSEYGVAAVDFQLAGEVNTGAYKISAVLGNTSSEKTVTVEHYVLPKFAVKLSTERPFYLPGQHVKGSLQADYFFGKPVAGGKVVIEGYTFDVARTVVLNLQGTTSEKGSYEFEFDLPTYVAGTELEGGLGRFYLQASITDLAQHSETSNLSLPISQYGLVVEAIPEGGDFKPGLDNIIYVLASYPDGTPAESDLVLTFYNDNSSVTARTGPYGVAEVHYTPQVKYGSFHIEARDARGNTAAQDFNYDTNYYDESILLRTDKPVYQVGEPMQLNLWTTQPAGMVYLDIVRSGQTVSTRAIEMSGGKATVTVDLTPDLYGTLELHAYKILTGGQIMRDTRLVVVNNAQDLNIALKTLCPTEEQDTEVGCIYRPGEQAALDIQVNGADGNGAQSILGLAIVDESVFALAEQDPGFAKLYFMLEQELLVPKYDLHGFSIPDLVTPSTQENTPGTNPQLREAVSQVASASLAAAALQVAAPTTDVFSLNANTYYLAVERANQIQGKFFSGMSKILYGIFLFIPVVGMGLVIYPLARDRKFWRSTGLTAGILILSVLLVILLPLGDYNTWPRPFTYNLGTIIEGLTHNVWGLLIFALAALGSYIYLVVYAIKNKDAFLGALAVTFPIFVATLIGLAYASNKADVSPSNGVFIFALLAYILFPVGFLLRASGYFWMKKTTPAITSLVVSAFLIIGIFPIISMAGQFGALSGPAGRMARNGVVVDQEFMVVEKAALPPMVAATQAPAAMEATKGEEAGGTSAEPPRLRQYFPETMLWLPDPVTDPDGFLHLEFPVADSITTWRMTALASTRDGRLGSTTAPLRVFQDFFIDLDLPVALTVGDEVAVPVGVYNYLPESQTVRLELAQAEWFDLLDEPVKELSINSNDIQVVYFRVKAKDFGTQALKVTAIGSKMSDAIQKEVRVFPNGKQITFTQSDRLTPGTPVRQTVAIPTEAIPGTQTLLVKVYPGVLSQVVEGLDSILRMPYGCFEQTSSTTYPNVLVLDYLKSTNQASPEVQMKAEEYINLGYQRLTTFEVKSSGGFSLFGEEPADRMLTAYGLQEFADMNRVHEVDPALIERAARWLLAQQDSDGSWENDRGLVHENTWSSLGNDRLPVTAYIAWSLVEAGYGQVSGTQNGLRYVREHLPEAKDPYVVALVANALVAADIKAGMSGKLSGQTMQSLNLLADMAKQDGNSIFWQSSVATFMGSEGKTGSIETTALAALAFLKADTQPALANSALVYLVRQMDSFGTWYNTQATVLSLKALIQSVRSGAEKVNATVTVTLNGSQTRTIQVTPENFDVVQLLSFSDINIGKENVVDIKVEGEGNLMYQVTGAYYLPWEKLALYPELSGAGKEPVTIEVTYDRAELAVNDTVKVDVSISLNQPGGRAESAMIDLGLPPGFTVQTEDLEALIAYYKDTPGDYPYPKIERFELTGRQILLYVSNLSNGNPLKFSYRLKAKFPLIAQTPASSAYDYYNPDVNGEATPQVLVVKESKP